MRSEDWLRKNRIAHRGVWDEQSPENSIGAFERAIEQGHPIECDVRILKDGEIVVFHDRNTLRMTGYDLLLENCTYEELCHVHLRGTNYQIPRLRDFLHAVNGTVPILIEIKTTTKRKECIENLRKHLVDYHGLYALASFDPFIVRLAKNTMPHIACGQHFSDYGNDHFFVRSMKKYGMYGLWLIGMHVPDFFICKASMLPRCLIVFFARKFNKPILTWNVQNENKRKKIASFITNEICEM